MLNKIIENLLQEKFQPQVLKIEDESKFHFNHIERKNIKNSSESHFSVMIVSDFFYGMSFVNRHKEVYKTLNDLLIRGDLHAINIKALTLTEYNQNN